MKERLLKMLKAKQARKVEIDQLANKTENPEELRKLIGELDLINNEIRDINGMIDEIKDESDGNEGDYNERTAAVNGEIPAVVQASVANEKKNSGNNEIEKRVAQVAADLRDNKEVQITSEVQQYLEKRAITTGSVLLENKYKRTVADNFNEVAQTIDLVDAFNLPGGNSYTVPFQIADGDADYTDEGDTFKNSEGTFGVATTGRAKITNSAIVSEEVVELPDADYLSRIVASVRKSIRKKGSHQIIAGSGGENQLRGIYNMPTNLIPSTYKVEVEAIDKNTLRAIVFAYGNDEDVESPLTLFLSKKDLHAFASIEATDGKPYYKITYNGPNGTIQDANGGLMVPYTINSACKSLSDSATVAGDKTMVYGDPMAYEMPLFSPLTIKRSDERYIDQGKIGFFGKQIAGGVLNRYKSFIPVVKK